MKQITIKVMGDIDMSTPVTTVRTPKHFDFNLRVYGESPVSCDSDDMQLPNVINNDKPLKSSAKKYDMPSILDVLINAKEYKPELLVKIKEITIKDSPRINIMDEKENTALHYALQKNLINPELIKYLLSHHADPNVTNDLGQSPFYVFVCNGLLYLHTKDFFSIFNLFIQNGADLTEEIYKKLMETDHKKIIKLPEQPHMKKLCCVIL